MSEELLYRFIAVFGAGLGLFLAGGVNLLAIRKTVLARLALGSGAAFAGGMLIYVYIPLVYAAASAAAALAASLILFSVGSVGFPKLMSTCLIAFRRPIGQTIVLGVTSVALMAGTVSSMTAIDEDEIDKDMQWLVESSWQPETRPATISAMTDKGNLITPKEAVAPRAPSAVQATELRVLGSMCADGRVIRICPATDSHNCHGWVFTGGRYWLSPDDVEKILVDNGYKPVSDPRAGDVVIYRQGGQISHTALVRAPAANGRPVLVEGKWGWMGVYLHGADDSCYGKMYSYYRSARLGHVIAGLDGQPAKVAGQPHDNQQVIEGAN